MGRVAQRPASVEQAFPEPARVALARAIEETAARWPDCRCEVREAMSRAELVALGAGCTARLGYTCDRLAAVRRRCLR